MSLDLLITYAVVGIVVVIWVASWGAILRKAGYSGWLALLWIVPVVNLFLLLWFATASWPVGDRSTGFSPDAEAEATRALKAAVRKAMSLEERGEAEEAIRQYERVAALAGSGHPTAEMARERIRELRTASSGDET